MTLQECYAAFGGGYEEVLGRLRSERLIQKFALKFLDDGSFRQLCEAVAAQDRENAFRAAHTLKGVCQNLGFDRLGGSSSRITDALRDAWPPDADALLEEVRADYEETAGALRAYRAENGL